MGWFIFIFNFLVKKQQKKIGVKIYIFRFGECVPDESTLHYLYIHFQYAYNSDIQIILPCIYFWKCMNIQTIHEKEFDINFSTNEQP